jgi:hypothetical protein
MPGKGQIGLKKLKQAWKSAKSTELKKCKRPEKAQTGLKKRNRAEKAQTVLKKCTQPEKV